MESNTIIVTEIRVNEIVFQKNALKTTLLKVPNTILKHMSGEKHACSTRHLLIPWSGGAFAPLGPFLCPTTEEKKWPIAPKPGP